MPHPAFSSHRSNQFFVPDFLIGFALVLTFMIWYPISARAQGQHQYPWSAWVRIPDNRSNGVQESFRKGDNSFMERGLIFLRFFNGYDREVLGEITFQIINENTGGIENESCGFDMKPQGTYEKEGNWFIVPDRTESPEQYKNQRFSLSSIRLKSLWMADDQGVMRQIYPNDEMAEAAQRERLRREEEARRQEQLKREQAAEQQRQAEAEQQRLVEQRRIQAEQAERQKELEEQRKREELEARAAEQEKLSDRAQKTQEDALNLGLELMDLLYYDGEYSQFRGTSWRFSLNGGIGGLGFPVYSSEALGVGLSLGAEVWPVVSRYFGIGGFASGTIGVASAVGMTSNAMIGYGGGRAYLSSGPIGVLFEIGVGKLYGYTGGDLAGTGTDAAFFDEGTYSLIRPGIGVRLGSLKKGAIDVMFLYDRLKIGKNLLEGIEGEVDERRTPPVIRVTGWWPNGLLVNGEYAKEYPFQGSSQGYWHFSIGKALDLFGKPYGK